MNDPIFRQQLVDLLTKGQAHVTFADAVRDLSPDLRGRRPARGIHSVWETVEHLRIAQEDILRYTLEAGWESPAFPSGYWPAPESVPTDTEWRASLEAFKRDLDGACALARDPGRDLTALIPHGEGRTYLRQILLIADHNSYHTGEIVQARKLLGAWKPGT